MRPAFVCVTALCLSSSSQAATTPVVGPYTQWQGRYIDVGDGSAKMDWPGTRFRFTVSGTTTVSLTVQTGNSYGFLRSYFDGAAGATVLVNDTRSQYVMVQGVSSNILLGQ